MVVQGGMEGRESRRVKPNQFQARVPRGTFKKKKKKFLFCHRTASTLLRAENRSHALHACVRCWLDRSSTSTVCIVLYYECTLALPRENIILDESAARFRIASGFWLYIICTYFEVCIRMHTTPSVYACMYTMLYGRTPGKLLNTLPCCSFVFFPSLLLFRLAPPPQGKSRPENRLRRGGCLTPTADIP